MGAFVSKAHRLLYRSILGSRVTKKQKKKRACCAEGGQPTRVLGQVHGDFLGPVHGDFLAECRCLGQSNATFLPSGPVHGDLGLPRRPAHGVLGQFRATFFPSAAAKLISQKVFLKLFLEIQFPHKFVNLFFISVIAKEKLKDFVGELTSAKRLERHSV